MELILLQNVQNLGGLGDRVKVKRGYGRNYLMPQGMAVPATAANVEMFEARRAEFEARAAQATGDAQARAATLEDAMVTIKANASAEGKLFGSVGPREIADAFTAIGKPVSNSEVVMPEGPIRQVGEFEVIVKLHATIDQTVKVVVVAE
ncbi:MAG: 50S ribosomal protein L9 [Xanthomonadales bacterium]|nr:50S ribosomal protein L9 [Xanthomonadales bacterium]